MTKNMIPEKLASGKLFNRYSFDSDLSLLEPWILNIINLELDKMYYTRAHMVASEPESNVYYVITESEQIIKFTIGTTTRLCVPVDADGNVTSYIISTQDKAEWRAHNPIANDGIITFTQYNANSSSDENNTSRRKWIMLGSIAGGAILLIWLLVAVIFTDERAAIREAKRELEQTVNVSGASLVSTYDLAAQLIQREDQELKQFGEYRVTGGFEYKSNDGKENGRRRFSLYVRFKGNDFQANQPTFERDYSR